MRFPNVSFVNSIGISNRKSLHTKCLMFARHFLFLRERKREITNVTPAIEAHAMCLSICHLLSLYDDVNTIGESHEQRLQVNTRT